MIRLSKFSSVSQEGNSKQSVHKEKPGVSVQDVGDIPFQHHFSLSPAGLAWVEDFCADRRSTGDKMLHLLAVNTQKKQVC